MGTVRIYCDFIPPEELKIQLDSLNLGNKIGLKLVYQEKKGRDVPPEFLDLLHWETWTVQVKILAVRRLISYSAEQAEKWLKPNPYVYVKLSTGLPVKIYHSEGEAAVAHRLIALCDSGMVERVEFR